MATPNFTKLDPGQVLKGSYDEANEALKIIGVGGNLVPDRFSRIELTYITSGPGTGEIGTVIYKLDGTTIATLTLEYDISNNLVAVERT